jgi:hypothetical protein
MIKLTKQQATLYKKKWRQMESIEIQELQTAPMSLKFKQLCLLMNSFRFPQSGKEREKEINTVRKRWIVLKKNGSQ